MREASMSLCPILILVTASLCSAEPPDAAKFREELGTLKELGKTAKAPKEAYEVVETALKLVDSAIENDIYDVGELLALEARSVAPNSKDTSLIERANRKVSDVRRLKTQFDRTASALKRLQEKPDDPTANLAVGKFTCFDKGLWDRGLPLLAKGSDPKLAKIAELDLSQPTDTQKILEVADAWYEYDKGRAIKWYRQVIPQLDGLKKLKAEQRIDAYDTEVGRIAGSIVGKWSVTTATNPPHVMVAEFLAEGKVRYHETNGKLIKEATWSKANDKYVVRSDMVTWTFTMSGDTIQGELQDGTKRTGKRGLK